MIRHHQGLIPGVPKAKSSVNKDLTPSSSSSGKRHLSCYFRSQQVCRTSRGHRAGQRQGDETAGPAGGQDRTRGHASAPGQVEGATVTKSSALQMHISNGFIRDVG